MRPLNSFIQGSIMDIKKISQLAQIELNEAEIEQYQQELHNVFSIVDGIKSVDTTGVEPLTHPLEITQPLRHDQVTAGNEREKHLANAPSAQAGLFLVPRVIDNNQ